MKREAFVPVISVSSTESVASPELVTVTFWELVEPTVTLPKLVVLPTEIAPLLNVG